MLEHLNLFKELSSVCGNQYVAINYISSLARKLNTIYRNAHVSESKLITWVLTGNCPYSKEDLEHRLTYDPDIERMNSILCYVNDEEVCEEVRHLYKESLHNKNLTLSCNNNLDTFRRSRANVLLRMIWYDFSEEDMM